MAQLRIVEGPGTGFLLKLTNKRATLGRDSTNDIKLEDPKASRVHCEITVSKDRYVLRDLNSSNGVWNDNGAVEQAELSDGYLFRIGHTYIRFESEDEEEVNQTIAYDDKDLSWAIKGLDDSSALFASSVIKDPSIREAHDCLVLLHEVVLRSHEAKTRDELFEILDDSAADALEGDRCGRLFANTHRLGLMATTRTTPACALWFDAVYRNRPPRSTQNGRAPIMHQ